MAKKAEDDDEDDGHRLDFYVSTPTYNYLLAIKRRRTHGGTVTAVVRRLIDDGIQSAVDREYIELQDEDDSKSAS